MISPKVEGSSKHDAANTKDPKKKKSKVNRAGRP